MPDIFDAANLEEAWESATSEDDFESNWQRSLRRLACGTIAGGLALGLLGVAASKAGWDRLKSLSPSPITKPTPTPTSRLGVPVFPHLEIPSTTSTTRQSSGTAGRPTSTTSTTLLSQSNATLPPRKTPTQPSIIPPPRIPLAPEINP